MLAVCATVFVIGAAALLFGGDPVRAECAAQEPICITLTYRDKVWQYLAREHESPNFYFQSRAARFGRWGDRLARADLLDKVRKMGFSAEDSLNYVFVGLGAQLVEVRQAIDRPYRDAQYHFDSSNKKNPFSFSREECGYAVDFDQILENIVAQLRIKNAVCVEIKPTILEPVVRLSDIEHYATMRGSFFTSFNTNVTNRKNNISVAAKMFDGLEMPVGEEFSFNKITGRRSGENGYMPAKIIVDKKYVEGYGGGVCQVSTTLYNALLLSGVSVLEVHSHSLVSSYVNMGFDAMVNFGSADLRWVNDTESRLFVQSFVEGNRVNFRIYGARVPLGYTFRRVTEVEKTFLPPEDEVIVDTAGEYSHLVTFCDETAYQTLPQNGYRVRAILETYEGEKLKKRTLLRRVTYPAVRGVLVYGAKQRPVETEPEQKGVSAPLDKNIIDFWQNFA